MDIKVRNKAKELIKEFEGLSLTRYRCSAGVSTIGFGHAIKPGEAIGNTILKKKAEELLEEDIDIAYSCLVRNIKKVELNVNQQAALISFIFNLGSGTFQSSTLRQKLLRGEYVDASKEISKFVYAGGRKLNGLVRRREAEKVLFDTPIHFYKQKNNSIGIISYIKSIFKHVKAEV